MATFCTQCGNNLGSGDRFCGKCGVAVAAGKPATDRSADSDLGWEDNIRYVDIIEQPEVAKAFDLARQEGLSTVSADEFSSLLAPLVPIKGMGKGTFRAAESIGYKMYEKIGLVRTTTDSRDYSNPVGKVIAAVACAMASTRLEVLEVSQQEDGCSISMRVPPGLTSGAKQLQIAVTRSPGGAHAEVNLRAPLLSWSKSSNRNVLAAFHDDISRFLALIG